MSRWRSIMRAGLRPGVSLQHNDSAPAPVDALHALGRTKHPVAATLVRASLGRIDDEVAFDIAIGTVAGAVFHGKQWRVEVTRSAVEPGQLMTRFCRQVGREFLGEQCTRCRGRQIIGRNVGGKTDADKSGAVRSCPECDGTGLIRDAARARARALGISHSAVIRTWGGRFDAVLVRLREISGQGIAGISADLSDIDS